MTARYAVMAVAEARASGKRAAGMVSRVAAERVCRLANAGKATIGAWTTGPDDTCAIVDARTAADGSPLPALCECIGERVRTQGDRARCGRCGRQFAIAAADGRDAPAGERRPASGWRNRSYNGGEAHDLKIAVSVKGGDGASTTWTAVTLWAERLRGNSASAAWSWVVEDDDGDVISGHAPTLVSAQLAAESAAEALLVAALEELRGGRK